MTIGDGGGSADFSADVILGTAQMNILLPQSESPQNVQSTSVIARRHTVPTWQSASSLHCNENPLPSERERIPTAVCALPRNDGGRREAAAPIFICPKINECQNHRLISNFCLSLRGGTACRRGNLHLICAALKTHCRPKEDGFPRQCAHCLGMTAEDGRRQRRFFCRCDFRHRQSEYPSAAV